MWGGGIGSASIVLIFTVLCLTIFAVISLIPALTEQNLIKAEVQLVKDYYAADLLAERILDEILLAEVQNSEKIMGIEISSYWDWDLLAERVSFVCPISETRELYVAVEIGEDFYDILTWRVRITTEWEPDDRLNVWPGYFDWGL